MAITITATPVVDGLYVDYSVAGLVPGTFYDFYRQQRRFVGDDTGGNPIYDLEYPDRPQLWRALAHRVAWQAPTATVTFRDYEPPLRPHVLYAVESSLVNPHEWDWNAGTYNTGQGTLAATVIHFNRTLTAQGDSKPGGVLVRSTTELGLFSSCCVYDLTVAYPARGTELPVLGRQFATYIADTREARRGTLTLVTTTLGDYYDLRRIAFPADGRMRPIVLNAGGDPTMLLDDMTAIPLNVAIDQATQADPDRRYVAIDYVETDPTDPLLYRAGDNDNEVTPPVANFTISNTSPKTNVAVTLTSTSTGQHDLWDWTLPARTTISMGKANHQGPLTVAFKSKGRKTLKLRVSGPAGASTKTATMTVR